MRSTRSPVLNSTELRSRGFGITGRLGAVVLPHVDDGHGTARQPRWEYGYDVGGNLTLIRDPLDNNLGGSENRETTWNLTHPLDGSSTTTHTLPLGQSERDEYDGMGRQTLHVDFNRQATGFLYDDDTRLPVGQQKHLGIARLKGVNLDHPSPKLIGPIAPAASSEEVSELLLAIQQKQDEFYKRHQKMSRN